MVQMQSMEEQGVSGSHSPLSGGQMVAADGRELPFLGCSLHVEAESGLARVVLRQVFRNDGDEPLEVTYKVPLPADAAVGGYSFKLKDRRIIGEIERRAEARKQYEDAILEGKTASLLDQERSSVFTQFLGNIPPKTDITCELELDQRLRWIDGRWAWRFPTVIAPRYSGLESVEDPGKHERVQVDVLDSGSPARVTFQLHISDSMSTADAITSPTHEICFKSEGSWSTVSLVAEDGAPLTRDIEVQWKVARPEVGVSVETARPSSDSRLADSAYGLITVVPPSALDPDRVIPRDLSILIDTSGSMHGEPLQVAKQAVLSIIESLEEKDRFELIEFSMSPNRWRTSPMSGIPAAKAEAAEWVRELQAGGGTEMSSGMILAVRRLDPDHQRQVILVTDGLVSFESNVVEIVRRSAEHHCRVHVVGIGSAPNLTLTAGVARAGNGGEFFLSLEENPRDAVRPLIERTTSPMVVGLKLRGTAVVDTPTPVLPDLLGASPALVPVRMNPEGGELVIEGTTSSGIWSERLEVEPIESGHGREAVVRLYGRELAEQLEVQKEVGHEIDHRLEQIGLMYRISTRLTSWIAISEQQTVDRQDPLKRVRIPQALPDGLSAEGLGLHQAEAATRIHIRERGAVCHTVCDLADYDIHPEPLARKHALRDRLSMPEHSVLPPAKFVSFKDGSLIIEFELVDELEWCPDCVFAHWAEHAYVDRSITTRDGLFGPGHMIRLALNGIDVDARRIGDFMLIMGNGEKQWVTISNIHD